MNRQRLLVPVAASTTGIAIVATSALYTAAFSSLGSDGPNSTGYTLLADANHAMVIDALVLGLLGIVLAAVGRSRFVVAALVVATAVTSTAAVGAKSIGQALAGMRPAAQPSDLNSLLLALEGSGHDVLPAGVLFAAAAIAASAVIGLRGRRLRRRAFAQA